jgi:DNA-binding GntR family transcriptional regulator
MAEHRKIIDALRERNPDAVEKAIRDNFQKTQAMVQQINEE